MQQAVVKTWAPEGEVETPYMRARQEWDARMGGLVVQAANWRRATFVLAGLLGVALVGCIVLGTLPKAVPHIVTIDQLGAATYHGPVGRSVQNFSPSEASLNYHLRRWVEDVRSISSDPAVVKKNWFEAYALTTQTGSNLLNGFVQQKDPFARLGEGERVGIEIASVVRSAGDSWQVDWRETTWNKAGVVLSTVPWRGIFRIVVRPSSKPDELARNPLGFFVDEFHWDRVVDGPDKSARN